MFTICSCRPSNTKFNSTFSGNNFTAGKVNFSALGNSSACGQFKHAYGANSDNITSNTASFCNTIDGANTYTIACCNIMLNTAVAESLKQFADELEGTDNFESSLHALIQKTIKAHKRIIFNGNGYEDAWLEEAARRGLSNLRTTPDCVPHMLDKKNVEMLTSHKVYTTAELEARCEILLENYCKVVRIEALTMVEMAKKEILPAVEAYVSSLVSVASAKRSLDADIPSSYEQKLIKRLATLVDTIDCRTASLESEMVKLDTMGDFTEEAAFIRDKVIPQMSELRVVVAYLVLHNS